MSNDLVVLAKRGDPASVQAILNQDLRQLGMNVAGISYQPSRMQLMLEANELPDKDAIITYLSEQIAELLIPNVTQLHIYCRRAGEAFPLWEQVVPVYNDVQTHYQLAHEGHMRSLQFLIGLSYAPQNVKVAEVALQNGCVHIVLESVIIPHQPSAVEFLRSYMAQLRSPHVASIQVYARQPNQQFPAWTQQTPVHLPQQAAPQAAPAPVQQSVQQSINIHIEQPRQAQNEGPRCPDCGTTAVHVEKQGFGYGKALAGALIAGPVGLLAGGINKDKIHMKCLVCGNHWTA